MGNIGYLIPSIKKEEFNLNSIKDLIEKNFDGIRVEYFESELNLYAEIRKGFFKKKSEEEFLFSIFEEECYLINPKCVQENKDYEIKNGIYEKNDLLETIMKKNLDFKNSIAFTYPPNFYFINYRTSILTFLRNYFDAYDFDEGTFPDYIKNNEKF
jgi:hypothetical protein